MTTRVALLLTNRYPPAGGGLEASVERIARLLAATGTITPIVYVRANEPAEAERDGIAVRPASHLHIAKLDPNVRHVLVSFYAAQEGLIGDEAARSLQIPHIVAIRGTDYSYGFHEPETYGLLRELLGRAAWITTTNDEQTRAVRESMGRHNVTRIHNSLPGAARSLQHRTRPGDGTVRLFADCGYSFKKGTIVLLNAFAALCAEGMPVALTMAGGDESGNGAFWRDTRDTFSRLHGDRIRFCGRIGEADVRAHLLGADVYCSATLGEGCSLARSAAMVAGIPIVSTRCGELADLAAGSAHVRLAEPADADGFLEVLRGTCTDVLAGRVEIDTNAVERWRAYFRPEREQAQWLGCIDEVLSCTRPN